MRVSLLQTQHWLSKMGLLAADAVGDLPGDVPAEAIAALMKSVQAPEGRYGFLGPVLSMSATPPGAVRPPVPLGYHPAAWPKD